MKVLKEDAMEKREKIIRKQLCIILSILLIIRRIKEVICLNIYIEARSAL